MALSLEGCPLSRAEYDALVQRGALEDARVELLHGLIVTMSPHGKPHGYGITALTALLVPAVGARGKVRVQLSLAVSASSEPEPDVGRVREQREPGEVAALVLARDQADQAERRPRDRRTAAVVAGEPQQDLGRRDRRPCRGGCRRHGRRLCERSGSAGGGRDYRIGTFSCVAGRRSI